MLINETIMSERIFDKLISLARENDPKIKCGFLIGQTKGK